MSTVVYIKNKLRVNEAGMLIVPGGEPTTSITAISLAKVATPRSVIPVAEALALIPGSRLVRAYSPFGLFFELPAGPPPDGQVCPAGCSEDWYKLLRENAIEEPMQSDEECAGFNYSGFPEGIDPLLTSRDATTRPNSNPL